MSAPAVAPVEPPSTARERRPWIDRETVRADGILAAVSLGLLAVPTLLLMVLITDTGPTWLLAIVVTAALAGAILIRRTRPVLALAGLTLLAGLHVAVQAWLFPVWFGVLIVLYSIGRFSRWPGRLAGLGIAFVASLLAGYWLMAVTSIDGVQTGWGLVQAMSFLWFPPMLLFSLAILTGWGAAAVERSTAATEVAQVSLRRADQEEERAALARDMHDVVAHSLAVVIAQANGARYADTVATKDESLQQIAQTASAALGDAMRTALVDGRLDAGAFLVLLVWGVLAAVVARRFLRWSD